MPRFALVLITASSLALPAAAHPGHGAAEKAWSLTHQLTEPLHVVPLLAVIVVAGFAAARVRRRQRASNR